MRVKATDQGLIIPKEFLEGIQEFEIRRENHHIVLIPTIVPDPIWQLGSSPISLGTPDASENHDRYLYNIDFQSELTCIVDH